MNKDYFSIKEIFYSMDSKDLENYVCINFSLFIIIFKKKTFT